jgi:hypothetical protein
MVQELYVTESRPDPEDVIVMDEAVRYEVRRLMKEGVYHQDDLFNILYPVYEGHYARLRNIIAEEKNNA